MTEYEYTGPRIGDRVAVETRGQVVELQDRGNVPGALVELAAGGQVWLPLDALVLLVRRGAEA
jgi:hypothetical protein